MSITQTAREQFDYLNLRQKSKEFAKIEQNIQFYQMSSFFYNLLKVKIKKSNLFKSKTLIEVGAFDGSDSLIYHSEGYNVYTFEPKKDLFENLVSRTKHLTNYNVIPKAVSLVNGKTSFNICKNGGASSILPFRSDEELLETWSSERPDVHYSGISYEVETTRLDSFIEEYKLQNTMIDFIHIDAQGVDLDVLKSLGNYLHNVIEGVLETVKNKDKSIYISQNNNTYDNVESFLVSNGFQITNVQSNDPTDCEYNVYFRKI